MIESHTTSLPQALTKRRIPLDFAVDLFRCPASGEAATVSRPQGAVRRKSLWFNQSPLPRPDPGNGLAAERTPGSGESDVSSQRSMGAELGTSDNRDYGDGVLGARETVEGRFEPEA